MNGPCSMRTDKQEKYILEFIVSKFHTMRPLWKSTHLYEIYIKMNLTILGCNLKPETDYPERFLVIFHSPSRELLEW
jgi:hypothetical protein